ncbi:hypothetical protein M2360_000912 [Rhizobium sp. SG_E_25_P2]|uniref:hypothetical protein n=1 Tax=Rhizobium sp. SG_E_25_P2 TaxID=2879942 RepID=UPI0024770974|nr:hypothetical protein [Rhizobium sp. SG_E_25_P2]MDH6265522.1 hypothetical protein [Rhizobium sp. SG_E_25_P2]
MSAALPIIDELNDMGARMTVAAWLQRCPLGLIALHHDKIRKLLIKKGFAEAVTCLEAELALSMSVRAPDGTFQQGPNFSAHLARGEMRIAAKGPERDGGLA